MPAAPGVDPAFFTSWEEYFEKALPYRGSKIRAKYKNGDVITGTVLLVWACMDTVAFKIEPDSMKGTTLNFLPELEDGWDLIGV